MLKCMNKDKLTTVVSFGEATAVLLASKELLSKMTAIRRNFFVSKEFSLFANSFITNVFPPPDARRL